MGVFGRGKLIAKALRQAAVGRVFAVDARKRLRSPGRSARHRLSGEMIVSLTSFPPRFPTLHLTLACLLDQSVRPDRVILWIADEDMRALPPSVTRLRERGLEIRSSDDLRSYKKLVPALAAFPDAWIATADDDVHYRRDWLGELIAGLEGTSLITCHRAHRIRLSPDGRIAPYLSWQMGEHDRRARQPSTDIVPIGVGGILYPPGCLDRMATDRTLFQRLAPHGDDLWFYWCARLARTRHRKVGVNRWAISWPGSQTLSLWDTNEAGANDIAVNALAREYGNPVLM